MDNKKGLIIVTGSCGRIGTQIVKRLGDRYQIVGFELLKAIYASTSEELVPVDLSSDESVHQAFDHIKNFYGTEITAVIHLAAYYSFASKESPLYDKITVKGTERILRALQGFNVKQFIFSSSMLVHAPCSPSQTINEEWPLLAKWGYPASKIATEALIRRFDRMQMANLRIAGVYDDGCHSIPISHQIQRIYEKKLEAHLFSGDISHGASFLHMDDLVDALEMVVEQREKLPKDLTLLLGEAKTLSYDELQRKISHLIHGKEITTFSIPKCLAKIGSSIQCHLPFIKPPFIRPWMIDIADDNYTLNIDKAKKILGWVPKRSLEETLPKMIEALKHDPKQWYKENGL